MAYLCCVCETIIFPVRSKISYVPALCYSDLCRNCQYSVCYSCFGPNGSPSALCPLCLRETDRTQEVYQVLTSSLIEDVLSLVVSYTAPAFPDLTQISYVPMVLPSSFAIDESDSDSDSVEYSKCKQDIYVSIRTIAQLFVIN
jgi:hypothetical protein